MDKGIDYGNGLTSVDFETGIRYGVIPMNSLHEWAWESVEADYGEPHCPKCGNKVSDYSEFPDTEEEYTAYYQSCSDYFCENCKLILGSYDATGDEPICHILDDEEYKGQVDSTGDLFIIKSPYYTHAQFCSPCAPGAGYLLNYCEDGPKVYCLGKDWFTDEKCPYPVYRVSDGSLVSERYQECM